MSDKDIIAQQARQIAELQASLQAAMREVCELKALLAQNSGNSSRPPSSDGLRKAPAFPRLSGKARGGQKGHRGNTLQMVAQADQVVLHPVADVCSCGGDLSQVEGQVSARRQVFDLPPQVLVVTEHQSERKVCSGCGQVHQGAFPEDVVAPVQYGGRVKALVSLLSVGHNMPVGGIKGLFADLFGYALNEATIQRANALNYEQLAEEESIIRSQLQQEEVIHADESGVRTQGELHWLHVASSALFTYFYRHCKRGREALEDQRSVLSTFNGWVVHDCWASYFTGGGYQHALCGAHLLRELTALIEQGSQWARQMHELLMATYLDCDKGKACLSNTTLQTTISEYQVILREADREEPPPEPSSRGRDKQTKGRNLMNRLAKHRAAVLAFAQYETVPFTNNLAERDIRPWKTKLKVSGSFRTTTGADHYARIRSFISTARKQQKQVFAELCRMVNGESFLRDLKTT
ncbi:MAG: IS66 family transposase [Tunicatimonas sp.]